MKPLIHHLLGEARTAILAALLMRPEDALHVRELQRITGMSPGALHRELVALAGYGVLTRTEVGRQVFYQANAAHPALPDLTGLVRKTAGLADLLRSGLATLGDRVALAFVFGSMASGNAQAGSDVDVLVVGDATFADVVLALEPAGRVLQREINPVVMTPAQFDAKRAEAGSFVASLWNAPKLWLTDPAG